ncbi:MAG TPA: DUF1801 domain-containing protein [Candidatus Saccharimonadales bacterium]
MSTLKTLPNDADVTDFINAIDNEVRRRDSFALLEMYERLTGKPPRMWGDSIIGFGMYHYKSERSSQEGDWPLAAFSPRKQNLTMYFMPGFNNYTDLLQGLGKCKTSVGCLYIKKLADVDTAVLERLILRAYADAKKQYGEKQ